MRNAKSSFLKLQRHVRGQNRGSWVCPVHLDLDYFQVVDLCISRVFKVDFFKMDEYVSKYLNACSSTLNDEQNYGTVQVCFL